MYTLHRIRPGYWIIRNIYGEPIAEAQTLAECRNIVWGITAAQAVHQKEN